MQDPLEKPGKEPVLRSVLLQTMSDIPGLQALCCCPRLQWKRVWDCFFNSLATSVLMNKQWFPSVHHCISRKKKTLCTLHCWRYCCYLYRYKRECAVHTSLSVRYVSPRKESHAFGGLFFWLCLTLSKSSRALFSISNLMLLVVSKTNRYK